MADNKPAHTITYGAIRISVWRNAGFFNLVPSRSFKTKDEDWRDSNSFSEFDLPLLAKAILDAHSWIQEYKATATETIALPPVPKAPVPDPEP